MSNAPPRFSSPRSGGGAIRCHPTSWPKLDQEIHLVQVDGFDTSPFEGEFGRHMAFFWPIGELDGLKARVEERGGTIIPEERTVPYKRFFFRDPINGYVFEVIDEAKTRKPA
jgi:hypothetical protein